MIVYHLGRYTNLVYNFLKIILVYSLIYLNIILLLDIVSFLLEMKIFTNAYYF